MQTESATREINIGEITKFSNREIYEFSTGKSQSYSPAIILYKIGHARNNMVTINYIWSLLQLLSLSLFLDDMFSK